MGDKIWFHDGTYLDKETGEHVDPSRPPPPPLPPPPPQTQYSGYNRQFQTAPGPPPIPRRRNLFIRSLSFIATYWRFIPAALAVLYFIYCLFCLIIGSKSVLEIVVTAIICTIIIVKSEDIVYFTIGLIFLSIIINIIIKACSW